MRCYVTDVKCNIGIEESKGGVSSWIRLGPRSVEALLDSLNHCIKAEDKGKWERGWRENGRVYSLVRDENKAGMFLRLGVADKEKRSWSPSLANGMDMERFGWLMARTWGLQGNLGLARMETGRVLLEFQHVGEAERVLVHGSRRVGGVQLGLERWRPRCGCEEEGGSRKEVWGLESSLRGRMEACRAGGHSGGGGLLLTIPMVGSEAGDEEVDLWK
ncbi:hypothetical protein CK203_080150 [Vitis vinifera]|uniref:DUF4283 domain-containing protein n=1 Tax=Vitis vinifera TaxID=29760 RepID=A0A438F2J6_VITVI|nr:hypothetical protein CK203_080150 [Vitis vinifera]